MPVLVNYFPCSYGDSLTNMFRGNQPRRLQGVVKFRSERVDPNILKYVEFYNFSSDKKIQCLHDLYSLNYVSCHRQNGFDFDSIVPDTTVISIVMDREDFLVKRLLDLHITKHSWGEKFALLKGRVSDHALLKKEYSNWARDNILESDIKLNFSTMMNYQQFQAWCNSNNLPFHSENVKEWIDDFQNYSTNAVQ